MFRCAITGKISQPREPQIRVVVETRKVSYTNSVPDPDDPLGGLVEKTTTGTEIVKEICVTKEGFEILMQRNETASDVLGATPKRLSL